MSVKWCPIGQIIADDMTKPVQGTQFKQFRDKIMGVEQVPPIDISLVPP